MIYDVFYLLLVLTEKLALLQQTVVRVSYILKNTKVSLI